MSVWTERDIVVLRWLHESPPQSGMVTTNWKSADRHHALPGLSQQDVHLAVETLIDEGLVHHRSDSWSGAGGVHWVDLQPTGAGLQALGEWPSFDALTSPAELGRLLDALAELAATDEEETNLRQAAASARSKSGEALQSLAAGAISALVRSQLG